jgi:predicted PurR-regulated permease PerM
MRLFLAMACVVIVSAGMYAIQVILAPFLFAVITGICAAPLLYWLVRKKVPKFLAAVITLVVVGALFISILLIILVAVDEFRAAIPEYAEGVNQHKAELTEAVDSVSPSVSETLDNTVDPTKLLDTIESLLSQFASLLAFGITMFLFVLYMIFDMDSLRRVFESLFGENSAVLGRFTGFTRDIQSYVFTQTWTGAIVGTLDALFLYWYGIPFAGLWGLLAFFMGFIPNIGFWLALIPPAILAFSIYGWSGVLVVVVVYNLINGSMEIFIKPRVIGHSVRVSTTVVFLSLTYWGFVLGPWGGLLAVPLTVMVKDLVLDAYPQTRPLSALISLQIKNLPSDAPPEPAAVPAAQDKPG